MILPMTSLRTCFCILFLLAAGSLTGQYLSEKNFATYTTANGLSDNTITGIAQDGTGYLWLSTLSGLDRYDGSRFKQYHSSNDSLSPASEEFLGMTRLDKDRLAFFSSGLYIINTQTGERRNIFIPYHDRQYEYKFNFIMGASGDNGEDIYILSRSGFYHFDKNYKLAFRFDFYTGEKVATEHFVFGRELMQLDDNRLLVISIDGLYLYNKEKKQFKKVTADDCLLLAEFLDYPKTDYKFFQAKPGELIVLKSAGDTLVYINVEKKTKAISRLPIPQLRSEFGWRSKLLLAQDTLLYITGQNSGFYKMRFYPESGAVKFYPEKYFTSYQCNNLFNDRDNNLWIATTRGLLRHDCMRLHVEVTDIPPPLENTFPGIRIHTVYTTKHKVYAGTRAGAGLLVYDKATLRLEKQIGLKNEPVTHPIYRISAVDSSTLLLGTGGSLFLYNEETGKQTKLNPPAWGQKDWTNELFNDRRGNTWISAVHIYMYNTADRIFSILPVTHSMPAIPFAFAEDTSGYMWVAGHGITRYNAALNTFDKRLDLFPFIKMPDKQVTAMIIDKQNIIWFGSINNGLISYDIDKKTFGHLTRSNGLPDDNIASLIIIGSKLWIACYSGIACMDLKSLQIKRFGKDEGMPEMPVMKGSKFYYDSSLQQLYLGFYTSIVRFNPYEMIGSTTRPAVFIENLNINGQKNIYLPEKRLSTSWQHNDLTITIGSVNFYDGQSQGYAYRIFRNENSPWQQLGNQPSFNISSLAPGRYRIQVKVYSLNNRWPELVKEINIEVLPPFWQKTWFLLLMMALLLTVLYLFINWRTGLARKKEMEKTQVQKLQAEDYKNRYELEQISNYFSSSLADKKTADQVLWDVAGHLIGRMNYVDCMIYLWNEDKTKMIQKAAYGPKGKPEYISSQLFDVLPGQGVVGHVIQTMQPVLIRDTRKDNRYRMDEAFRLSEICVPIIHNNELFGIIDSEHHEADYFTERDIQILTTIATLIGNKLKQLESEKTLEVKEQELTNINEQLAEAKLSALQAQMNPHFVFNALNSIKRMILDGDNEKASRYLSKFAQMIRMTLNHSKEAFITLRENTEYLMTYLEMEQLRFDGTFTWNISVAEDIDEEEILVPSLMIQPLVENAIWHGLLPSVGDKKLQIEFKRKQDKLSCTIEDNGIGFRRSLEEKLRQKTSHQSVGLDNLRNRIKILNEKFGAGCSLAIRELEDEQAGGRGTKVILEFTVINT
jgi:putative methionine-R-sulfoxide reductase with GAF domain